MFKKILLMLYETGKSYSVVNIFVILAPDETIALLDRPINRLQRDRSTLLLLRFCLKIR